MADHQEKTLEIIGIVRRWREDSNGNEELVLYMPEVSGDVVNPNYIECYAGRGGHGSGPWSIALAHSEKVNYEDEDVKEFVSRYERKNNVKLKLRTRNQYKISINI